jgi:hypothetical protein
MNDIETLRAASARLRELNADVGHVPTPWIQKPFPEKQGVLTAPGEDAPILLAFWGGVSEYVATLHPGVALALSNWLDAAAGRFDPEADIQETDRFDELALATARAILGEARDDRA